MPTCSVTVTVFSSLVYMLLSLLFEMAPKSLLMGSNLSRTSKDRHGPATRQSMLDIYTQLESMQRMVGLQLEALKAQREMLEERIGCSGTTQDLQQRRVLDAGYRLCATYDLLELCLLELPFEDVLTVSSVSRSFKHVVDTSRKLKSKLFLLPLVDDLSDYGPQINPIFAYSNIQLALPLFWDDTERRLAYCFRRGRIRLYCRAISEVPGMLRMELSSEEPPHDSCLDVDVRKHRMRILEKGSWKDMYLSKQACKIEWQARLTAVAEQRNRRMYIDPQRSERVFSGHVLGGTTMDHLLDALASSKPTEVPMSSS